MICKDNVYGRILMDEAKLSLNLLENILLWDWCEHKWHTNTIILHQIRINIL